MNFSKAIITGGAGFIGSYLTEELLQQGCQVLVIDNLRTGTLANLQSHFYNSNFFFEKKDIRSEGIYSIFKEFKPEIVFHLAAIPGVPYSVENPLETNDVNVQGTLNLLKISAQYNVKKFIFASSSSVYGGEVTLPSLEMATLKPKSPYALQKKIGEEYCQLFSSQFNLETICLRYFNVIGIKQSPVYAAVIPSFLKALQENKQPIIYGDGKQSRDFCPVENVVRANILAANHQKNFQGRAFNISCGKSTSINELAKLMKTKSPIHLPERLGDIKHSLADITLAKNELQYEVIVKPEDAIRKILEYYLSKLSG